MSFILDALKKSEAERQRQAGPTLLELRVTQPPRRYPAWALIVGALLAANVAVLLWVLLRRPAPAPPTAVMAAAAPVPAPPPVAAVAGSAGAVVAAPATPGAPSAPSASSTAATGTAPRAGAIVPQLAPGDASAAAGALAAAQTAPNPADEEPAVPADGGQVRSAAPASIDYSTLPSLSSLSGDFPTLRLDLLDFSELPSERYALINMHRVHEGDVLPEGARVLAIRPDGVAMEYRGQDFMLRASGAAQ